MKYVIPRRHEQLTIDVAQKVVFEANRGRRESRRSPARLVDLKISDTRCNHAHAIRESPAKLRSPDLDITAADGAG